MKHYSKPLFILSLFYTLFIIYGSLVPLKFQSVPWDIAVERFINIPYLDLGIHSRADWVANILLFIPFSFFWMLYLYFKHPVQIKFHPLHAFFILIAGIFLTFAIEFAQIYFPQRTVSINDLIAEMLGSVLGLIFYWGFGDLAKIWIMKWNTKNKQQVILYAYLFLLFGYGVLPLDLTISPVEIYHKWSDGKIYLIPFLYSFHGSIIEKAYQFSTDIIIWIPASILLILSTKKTPKQVLLWILGAALLLELIQLFIYSRISDTTDLITAFMGAWIGILIAKKWTLPHKKNNLSTSNQNQNNPFLWVIIWSLFLILLYWYPFDFKMDIYFIKERLALFFRAPFTAYYYGSEYRAITSLFNKVAFAIPLGVALAHLNKLIFLKFNAILSSKLLFFIAFIYVVLFSLLLELGQLFLVKKSIDSADCLLTILGSYIGYSLYQKLTTSSSKKTRISKIPSNKSVKIERIDHKIHNPHLFWKLFVVIALLYSIALFIIPKISGVPYNIVELLSGHYPIFNALGLTSTFFCCFGFPLFTIIRWQPNPLKVVYFVFLHVILTWLLIRLFIPLESIYDIIGFPTLKFLPELEMAGRFFALFLPFSIIFFIVAIQISRQFTIIYLRSYSLFFFLIFIAVPLSYWIVIEQAGTDNLTELLENNGHSFAVIGIIIYFFLLAMSSTLLSAVFTHFKQKNHILSFIIILISIPLSYYAIYWATEAYIFKYGQFFSALQFLLSPDRTQLVSGNTLIFRFILAQSVLLSLIFFSQIPFWFTNPSVKSKIIR